MLAAALLENDQPWPTGLLFNFANNRGPSHDGSANVNFSSIHNHEHVMELDLIASFAFELFDQNFVVRGNFILFAACLDDCVHITSIFPRPVEPFPNP